MAVIGDGAMTAGMAFEALNNAGSNHGLGHADMLVILNDNDMSISPPVGALNKYLARLMSGKFYAAAREGAKSVLKNTPLYELARRFEEHAKGMVVPGTIFEEFGFNYVGPIDGHDLDSLIPTLREPARARRARSSCTWSPRRAMGYKLAEADPVNYHGPGKFDPAVGLVKPATPPKQTFTQVFGQWLCDMAEADARLVGITPAMREGSGMVEFEKRFPKRYHDVGIAEQHAVTFAAGLACEGLKPVVAIYSTFLQRGYDQLIHDVAIQNLPVVFALDRAGIVGADGATHCGAFDIAYLRCVPNMGVIAPADENECRKALYGGVRAGPSGGGALPARRRCGRGGRARARAVAVGQGRDPARVEHGARQRPAHRDPGVRHLAVPGAGRRPSELDATVANMRFVKPLDAATGAAAGAHARRARHAWKRAAIMGGAGSAVAEAWPRRGLAMPVLQLGPARRVRRARRSGQAAGDVRARCGRHRAVDPAPLRRRQAGRGAPGREPLISRPGRLRLKSATAQG